MGTGKKKIEIKKIENLDARRVAFSRRRKGLFIKAKELEERFPGVKVAIVAFSGAGKPFAYGHLESILNGCCCFTPGKKDCTISLQRSGASDAAAAAASSFPPPPPSTVACSSSSSSSSSSAFAVWNGGNGGGLGGATSSSSYAGYTIQSVAASLKGYRY